MINACLLIVVFLIHRAWLWPAVTFFACLDVFLFTYGYFKDEHMLQRMTTLLIRPIDSFTWVLMMAFLLNKQFLLAFFSFVLGQSVSSLGSSLGVSTMQDKYLQPSLSEKLELIKEFRLIVYIISGFIFIYLIFICYKILGSTSQAIKISAIGSTIYFIFSNIIMFLNDPSKENGA